MVFIDDFNFSIYGSKLETPDINEPFSLTIKGEIDLLFLETFVSITVCLKDWQRREVRQESKRGRERLEGKILW